MSQTSASASAGKPTKWQTISSDLIVYLPSGAAFPAWNEDEADHMKRAIDGYTDMLRFDQQSDVGELDRLIQQELLAFRWGTWLALGETYDGKPLDPKLEEKWNKISLEIRQVKAKLGIDKITRDRTRGEGSPHQRITSILQRAQAFGLHRCHQMDTGLELINQLIALVQLHVNLAPHPEEQKEMRVTAEEIIDWVFTQLKPEFEAIDEHWRQHEQHMWHMEDARLETVGS